MQLNLRTNKMKKLILLILLVTAYVFPQADSTMMEIHTRSNTASTHYIIVTDTDTIYYKLSLANLVNFLKTYFVELSDSNLFATVNDMNVGLATKQATLVSGTNIKTVNSTSLVGSGDVSISSDTTGFWAIVNTLVETALSESDTLIGSAATLDSLITDYWAGTLGADTTGYWAMIYAVVVANAFDTTNVYVVTDSLASDIATKLTTSTYTAFISTLAGGDSAHVLAKLDSVDYNWTWGIITGDIDLSDNTPPNPPTNLVATADNDTAKIRLTWTDPNALDLDSIIVYRAVIADTTSYSAIDTVNAGVEAYTNTGLSTNTAYWYKLKAFDDSSNVSGYSNRDSATTLSGGGGGAEIFADDFEDGNATDDWTAYTHAGSNTITAATDSVYAGTYSAKYDWDGTNQNNYVSISVADATKIYITMYINYGSGFHTGTAWGVTPFLTLYDGATVIGGLSVQAGGAGADINNIQLDTNGDDAVFPDPNFLTNRWQKIELRWVRGATAGTGTMRVWWTHPVGGTLDSVSVANVADNTLLCDKIVFGTDQPETIVNASIVYFDNIKVDSTSQRP